VSFVLDASVALAWCFEDEASPASYAVLERARIEEVVAPSLWPLEVANILGVSERRGRLSAQRSATFVELLRDLELRIDVTSFEHAFGAVRRLAREHRLTCYDAAYLELAQREGLPLATRDASLREAAGRAGVTLLPA
jgi:predicted nucleic acid-binding protein